MTRGDIVAYRDSIHLAPQTVKNHVTNVKAFLNWAELALGIEAPNWKRVMPKVVLPDPVHLTEDELVRLFDVADNRHDRAMIMLLGQTGMRSGELRSLRREDVHDKYVEVTGKTGPQKKYILPGLADDLRRLGTDYVFTNLDGGPMTDSTVYKRVRRCYELAGIQKDRMGPHVLRHTFGTLSLKDTGNLRLVQKLMGHATLEMTMRYASMVDQDVQDSYRQLDFLNRLNGGDNGQPETESRV